MRNGETTRSPIEDLPQITLTADPPLVAVGQPAVISWNADADEVLMWQSSIGTEAPDAVNWSEIYHIAEPVEPAGEMTVEVQEPFAVFIFARTPRGVAAELQTVELKTEERSNHPENWCEEMLFSEHMVDHGPIRWKAEQPSSIEGFIGRVQPTGETWHAGPSVSISSPQHVIYTNESTVLNWSIAGSSCSTMGSTTRRTKLLVDTSQYAGTRYDGGGWGAGGQPPCSLASGSGSLPLKGMPLGARHQLHHLTANHPTGPTVVQRHWLDVLGVPQIQGCTPARVSAIRNAVRTVDAALRTGCIYNSTALDTKVGAFKNGHLSRIAVWNHLLAELQNLDLLTFNCQDYTGLPAGYSSGSWSDYSNTITLRWMGNTGPNLTYVILHELCHKAGFNSGLLGKYSKMEIELQAHQVAGACAV